MPLRPPLLSFALILFVTLASAKPGMTQTISTSCTLGQTSSLGLLVAIGSPLPTKLVSSSIEGGTPARLEINCTEPANLQVSAPMQTSGPSFNPASSVAKATASTGSQTNSDNPGQPLAMLPNVNGALTVDMMVDRGGNLLLAGTYGYNVILTLTP
jgi:hypothetical protein